MRVLSHEAPYRDRECPEARPQPRRNGTRERHHSRRTRRPLDDFEVEQPRLGIDGLDGPREHDAPAVQERRADDERRRLSPNGVPHDVPDDADSGTSRADDEPVGVCEPVLEHVATPAEHVRPHRASLPQPHLRPNLGPLDFQAQNDWIPHQKMPSVLARATASVREAAASFRRIALTWW